MTKHIHYNSWSLNYKSPYGAVHQKDSVSFQIKVEDPAVQAVLLRLKKDGGEVKDFEMALDNDQGFYRVSLDFKEGSGLYFYSFKLLAEDYVYYYGDNDYGSGGVGQVVDKEKDIKPYQLTVYSKDDHLPDWYQSGIAYQIFVDRFDNGNEDGTVDNPKPNSVIYTQDTPIPHYIKGDEGQILHWDFYGGNLKGVIKHLDYLKAMGISIIYLNPIFEAHSNHKYDTGDYFKIDPMFGDDEIFDELIGACDERGIKLILDGVFNHAGADSIYFNKFGNYDSLGAYQSQESPYADWFYFKEFPDDYDGWWGDGNLPRLNTENEEVRDFFFGDQDAVIPYWIQRGIGGWRIDVADEVTDRFLKDARQAMDAANPDTVLIGEVWEDASNKVSYGKRRKYINGGIMNGVMNYPLRQAILDLLMSRQSLDQALASILSLKENYPAKALYANLNNLGSHDTRRLATELEKDGAKIQLAYLMMYMSPGVPTIYYGDEMGLEGEKDPDNRRPFPWQEKKTSLQTYLKKLSHFRKDHPELAVGEFLPFQAGEILGILRQDYDQGQWTLALMNTSAQSQVFQVKDVRDATEFGLVDFLEDHHIQEEELAGHAFIIYTSRKEKVDHFN